MPKKLTEEQKLDNFNAWKETDEYNRIMDWATEHRSSIVPIEMSTKDINDNWEKFLTGLYDLCTTLKVPGRKVKGKINKSILNQVITFLLSPLSRL